MKRIILDDELRAKIGNLNSLTEVCDEKGNLIARITPVIMVDGVEYEAWVPNFDEEDLNRQDAANEKRYTTAEVLEHLGKLGNS